MDNTTDQYNGYALYSSNKKPLGVISVNGDRVVACNTNILPKNIKKYLIEIEDQRFYQHGAVDLRGISRAVYQNIIAGKIIQGGSTITQQLARNILKDNRKNIFRKVKETNLAFKLEKEYSKEQILNLYFGKVFWGKKNYGIRTASLEYFSKEPENLSTKEQIILLTLLRGPNYYLKNELSLNIRCNLISKVLHERKILSSFKYHKIKNIDVKIKNTNLEVFRTSVIPFISTKIEKNRKIISTTLNDDLQRELTKFITNCKYPTSVIGISNNKTICLGSSNGTDYPFVFKSNVGSTLKPFIYSYLRESGIKQSDLFSTFSADINNWNIKEVQKTDKTLLSLKDALLVSNNNVFVNASHEIGIDKTLLFLSSITKKPIINFVPSSILGATIEGFSLKELVQLYYNFFINTPSNLYKQECLSVLNQIAINKFDGEFQNSFLKTGTTNFNKERFAIIGNANTFFGFLRQGNELDDHSKEGGFISNILDFLKNISEKVYKWQ